ncbi:MAG: family 78 glycoside hydrolase catalytic domain, partial [Bacteroidota bacterium]
MRKIISHILIFILGGLMLNCTLTPKEKEVMPVNLQCDQVQNPLAINNTAPRLSWTLPLFEETQKQLAYHIIVSSSVEDINKNIGDLWDSGKINGGQSQHIKYDGIALHSKQQAYWKVRIWNQNDQPTEWSETSKWSIGLLEKEDWEANWIAISEDKKPDLPETDPAPYFRKEFRISKPIKSATVFVSGLGYYELYLNGEKVGNYALAPAPTNFDKRNMRHLLYKYNDRSSTRVLYNTFNVSKMLKQDENALGIILGNGWYNQRDRREEGWMWYNTPRLILQMEIEYSDGTSEKVISDNGWKVSTGALLHDGIFTGEVYDARLEHVGWNSPGFNDSLWQHSKIVRPPTGKLQAQLTPSDKVVRNIKPKSKTAISNNNYSYDFGEMFSGWVKIKIKGKNGTRISLRYFEEMGGDYRQKDIYILNGNGIEEYEPRFTWHAFRRVEISGISESTTLIDVTGRVVHTDVDSVGFFKSSNELFNKTYKNYIRTQLGNYHGSFSSDCPHRERLGYTGDGQLLVESSIFNFDMSRFYRKWLNDMADVQDSVTGFVPHTAPFGGGGGGPAWGSSYVIVPWYYYIYYGDTEVLEKHYSGMKHWIKYLGTRTDQNGLVVREEPGAWCLGDWAAPGKDEVPPPFVNTCYYFYVTDIMSKTAAVLGKENDKIFYSDLAKEIKNNINETYYDKEKKLYWQNRQGANAFPLAFGIVPEKDINPVLENLVDNILHNKGHFDSGILATPLILDVLSKFGREDIAFTLMNQRDYPGYGYVLEKNTTTLWEYWDGKLSHSHPMYGSVIRWFFKELAGINPDPENPGFKHIIIKPLVSGDLTHVSAGYRSIYGQIKSHWQIKDNSLHLDVEIPSNTSATVFVPVIGGNFVKIKTKSEWGKAEHIKSEGASTIYTISPGKYEFVSKNINGIIKPVHVSTPQITPYDTLFHKPQKANIYIESATTGAEIYYTLDGSKPDQKSIKYQGPFELDKNTVVKANAYKDGYISSFVKSIKVNFIDPKINGIEYAVYEGMWDKKPDLDKLKLVSSGKVYQFHVKNIKKRDDHIAIIFKSILEIDQDGDYIFYSSANDGSLLYLDDKVVVDNAGYFGNKTDNGKIYLQKGRHLIKVLYFENTGSESINVDIEGPNLVK